MKRRVMNVVRGILGVMCLLTALLWVRSYWRSDEIWISTIEGKGEEMRWRKWVISSGEGCIGVALIREVWFLPEGVKWPEGGVRYVCENNPEGPAAQTPWAWVGKFAGFEVIN